MSTKTQRDPINEKNQLIKLREHIEKNFEFVGDKFSEKVRDVYYDKDTKRSIYGTTTPEEKKELEEEGIDFLVELIKKEANIADAV